MGKREEYFPGNTMRNDTKAGSLNFCANLSVGRLRRLWFVFINVPPALKNNVNSAFVAVLYK